MSGETLKMVDAAVAMAKEKGGGTLAAIIMAGGALLWQLLDNQRHDYERFEDRIVGLESKVDLKITKLTEQLSDIDKAEIKRDSNSATILRDISKILQDIGAVSDEVTRLNKSLESTSREIMSLTWRIASLEEESGSRRIDPGAGYLQGDR